MLNVLKMYALSVVLALGFAGCDADVGAPAPTHAQYAEQLQAAGVDRTLLGRAWLDAARVALTEPTPVTLPYAEAGGFVGHEAGALGLAFAGVGGQELTLELTRLEPRERGLEAQGRIYAELFRTERLSDRIRHVRVAALPPSQSRLQIDLPQGATYVMRLQPELLTDARYHLILELEAALPFPVSGFEGSAVGSFFGAERDAGARHHEGVDIFAPRSTPVLAVADGRAMARVNRLGGNTVWLSTAGTSYYYAHLERQAITGTQRVRAGDVLGYVGNTGNAVTAPPHLHFGVYRWGKGAIDPLPLLGAHHFDDEFRVDAFERRYVTTRASRLNLRRAPSEDSEVIEQLPAARILQAAAQSGDWMRVRMPQQPAVVGWVHACYQAPLVDALYLWQATEPTFLLDSSAQNAAAVDLVGAGDELDALGEQDGHMLLRNPRNGRHGWVPIERASS